MILYFSGTGNSRHIAQQFALALNDTAQSVNDTLLTEAMHTSDTPYVIVAPIYAWRMARVMEDYLRRATLQGSKEIYFVLTCGSSMGNAGKWCRLLCEQKGWQYCGTAKVVMPENYIALFNVPDEATANRIVRAANRRAYALAEHIRKRESFPTPKVSLGGKFLSKSVNHGFYQYYVNDKKFTVSDTCTSCGKCARLCPLKNISLTDGKPVWQGNCTHCMACICSCPTQAIEYGKISVGKRRYLCPSLPKED